MHEKIIYPYNIWCRRLQRKKKLERTVHRQEEDTIKCILEKWGWKM
jgi:hypothetical protein